MEQDDILGILQESEKQKYLTIQREKQLIQIQQLLQND